jgi:hypothetical protein
MEEMTITTVKEMLGFAAECYGKGLYFRGERNDNKETACLPQRFRNPCACNAYNSEERNQEWFTNALESCGVRTPYHPVKGETTHDNILEASLNVPEKSWQLWGEEKLEALMTHYSPDFKKNYENIPFRATFLDISSDIMTALHFACFRLDCLCKEAKKPPKQETEEFGNGYLFVFDLNGIDNARYLKLVSYQNYAYFYKKENTLRYQQFDRITLQYGAFLAPKRDEKGCIEYAEFEKELKSHICKRVMFTAEVKRELSTIFGGINGFKHYFPEIPSEQPEIGEDKT